MSGDVEGTDHLDDKVDPERSSGDPGSKAHERDFRPPDRLGVDWRYPDRPKLDPDEFFKQAFPDPGDFAKWLEESDFLKDLGLAPGDYDAGLGSDEFSFARIESEDADTARGRVIHQARTDPAAAWELLGHRQADVQDAYGAWLLGGTDDEREQPRRQREAEAVLGDLESTSDSMQSMPGADGETASPSAGPTDSGPEPDEAGGWDNAAKQVRVTLPDGSEVTIETDLPPGNPDQPPTRQRTIDGDGNVGEWQPIDVVPDPPPPPPATEEAAPAPQPTEVSSARIWGLPRGLVFGGGGGILAMAMVGLVFVFSGGGGGDSGPWSVTDPRNDFMPTFADGDAIASPDSAGDVIGLDVAVADGNTTITVAFAGAAEGLMAPGGQELAASLQFIPADDGPWVDMLFNEDGSVKISDAPSGSRITATWTASDVLLFEILGLTPDPGATVRFATIQREGFGHSTDEVSLSTGGAGAAVATAFVTDDSGGSGGVPDAPVIVAACDVVDLEVVSAAFGPAELLRASGDAKTSRCAYETASGIGLDLSVQRRSNPRIDAFRPFRSTYDEPFDIRSLDWSDEGELRASEYEETSGAALVAFVHTSDSLGREIYVRIVAGGGAPGQGAVLAAAIEEFAILLRDAILEAQP